MTTYQPAVGALCEYSETMTSELVRQSCGPYNEYIGSLDFTCLNGTHGKLIWTPDENTPDLVYYQVGDCRMIYYVSSEEVGHNFHGMRI